MTSGMNLVGVVEEALGGSAVAFQLLMQAQPIEVADQAAGREFLLRADGVASILRQLLDGRLAPETAQAWANFARRGYWASDDWQRVRPVEIVYDTKCEDLIAEAVSRLDEIGDQVDGELADAESTAFIRALNECSD